jgi:hypothetical protein
MLAQGETAPSAAPASPPTVLVVKARERLLPAFDRAQRLLGRRSAARRGELAEGLQELTDAVATTIQALSDDVNPPTGDPTD